MRRNRVDLGPEGRSSDSRRGDSPNGQPMLLVANEISGTVTLFKVRLEVSTQDVMSQALQPQLAPRSVFVVVLALRRLE